MVEPTASLVDAGVNLASSQFEKDLADVMHRARAANVDALVAIGTCAKSSAECYSLARQHGGYVYATAGIHPHNADQFDEAARQQLLRLLGNPQVVAVGETGLDFNRNFSTPCKPAQGFHCPARNRQRLR
jgi:TatD DNase family protein